MVVLNSGNVNDNSIGFIASSSHQGLWHHSPQLPLQAGPAVQAYFGVGTGRLSRVPLSEQFTGHTALIVRQAGTVTFARGFVPANTALFIARQILSYIPGINRLRNFDQTTGTFQNDIQMLQDPTCLSYEIPCTAPQAAGFIAFFNNNQARFTQYALITSDGLNSFNCVIATITILQNYLLELGGGFDNYAMALLNLRGSNQGRLITDAFLTARLSP